jgi:Ala-tRNA(Pro) deacylase
LASNPSDSPARDDYLTVGIRRAASWDIIHAELIFHPNCLHGLALVITGTEELNFFPRRCIMKLMDFLDKVSANYEVTEHQTIFTSQQLAAEEHIPGLMVAKPVIVRADEEYYMCVLPACYKIDFDTFKRQVGASEIELADESEMANLFDDCALGAEPPFGVLYGLLTFMDTSLEDDEYIVFQGGTHETAVKMNMREYIRLARPRILSFCYPSL